MTKGTTLIFNRSGFTFLMALFIIVIIGILAASTGKSWSMITKREREKELLFRGTQIKEAIENWYNPRYIPGGGIGPKKVTPLMDLKDLLGSDQTADKNSYLPHNYATELDSNPRCAPDCAKLKLYQDPVTGKEWTVFRGNVPIPGGMMNGIIGIASKSEDTPFKTDFTGTSLENMGSIAIETTATNTGIATVRSLPGITLNGPSAPPAGLGGAVTKYSEWKFVYDANNDHAKLYRSYREGR